MGKVVMGVTAIVPLYDFILRDNGERVVVTVWVTRLFVT